MNYDPNARAPLNRAPSPYPDYSGEAVSRARGMIMMRRRLVSIFAASVGNLVEWYDFFVYSAFSLYFAQSFFPAGTDRTVQLLDAAGIYAVGFLIRPIGGWFMGVWADKYGRRSALTLAVMLMCMGSLVIAMCPTYAQIGVWAPAILVGARIMQGLSLGGEYGTSATYLSEISNNTHRGFWSSFQYVTLIGGQLLANLVLLVMQRFIFTHGELEAWGWRVPFYIGACFAVVGFWLRTNLLETDAFKQIAARTDRHTPMRELLNYPREIMLVMGLSLGGTLTFYTFTVYLLKFLVNTSGFSLNAATTVTTLSLLFYMLLQPLFGALSDRIGRHAIVIFFGVAGTLLTYPILSMLKASHDGPTTFALTAVALVVVSGYTAISPVVKAELFPASVRALGVGLPSAIVVSVFGGSTEYLALWLKEQGHEEWFFIYVTAGVFISLLVYLAMPATRSRSRFET